MSPTSTTIRCNPKSSCYDTCLILQIPYANPSSIPIIPSKRPTSNPIMQHPHFPRLFFLLLTVFFHLLPWATAHRHWVHVLERDNNLFCYSQFLSPPNFPLAADCRTALDMMPQGLHLEVNHLQSIGETAPERPIHLLLDKRKYRLPAISAMAPVS